jgi:mannosyltransferase
VPDDRRGEWILAGLLALAGLGLALVAFGDSLAGDEVFTEWVVDRSPGSILDVLRTSPPGSPESSPPLYFLVARATGALTGLEAGLRLPSLLAAGVTALLVFALARRVFSLPAALLAAALWACSPFVAFYAVEARPYALLMALSAASTLALLRALERGGRGSWVLWAGLAAAATLTHYTGIAVLAVQALWALAARPGRRGEVLAATAGAGALLLPWAIAARSSRGALEFNLALYDLLGPKTPGEFAGNAFRPLAGHPFAALGELPGTVAVVALCAVLVACPVDVAVRHHHTVRAFASSDAGLVAACAMAVPLALLLGDVVLDRSVFLPRSLAASLPAALVCLAGLVTASRLAAPAAVVAIGVFAAGGYLGTEREHRRPDFEAIAREIDRRAAPGEPVLVVSLAPPAAAGSRFVSRNFSKPHPEFFEGHDGAKAWAAGRRVFVVDTSSIPFQVPPGFTEVSRRVVPGWARAELITYMPPKG